MSTLTLPNGIQISAPAGSRTELEFIYRELFEEHCYERHCIQLRANAVILDVGANVGLFALRMKQLATRAKIYCFEPAPPTHECLVKNVARLQDVYPFRFALSDRAGSLELTYYPHAPGNSTLYPQAKPSEVRAMANGATLRWLWSINKLAGASLTALYPLRRLVLRRSFERLLRRPKAFACLTKTLDQVIGEHALTTIDLLKIDVEGAEKDVMSGLSDANLMGVRQLIIEVSPARKPWLPTLEHRLQKCGFEHVELGSMLQSDNPRTDAFPCVVYARRIESLGSRREVSTRETAG